MDVRSTAADRPGGKAMVERSKASRPWRAGGSVREDTDEHRCTKFLVKSDYKEAVPKTTTVGAAKTAPFFTFDLWIYPQYGQICL